MERSLSSIIKDWGTANLRKFGKGTNIHPDDRPMAFSVLFDEAIANGFSRKDIESKIKSILTYCVPEIKKAKTDGFFSYALREFIEILDMKFPETPSEIDFDKALDDLSKLFGLKKTIKRKVQDIEPRKIIEGCDDISSFTKDASIDDKLSISKISDEEKARLKNDLIESKIKKELIDPEKTLSEMYILSKEEVESNFIPDLDPEVKDFLGLNDKGEIA